MTVMIGRALVRLDVLLLVWALFLLSALLIRFRKKEDQALMWKKYRVYFLIVHLVFFCIALDWFAYAATVILVGATEEVWSLKQPDKKTSLWKTLPALLVMMVLGGGFLFFAAKTDRHALWSFYAAVVIFDGVSQMAGQAVGRTRFAGRISPNKTLEGFLAGWLFSFGALLLTGPQAGYSWIWLAALGPVALAGDLLASLYKRWVGVKDYGNWIPGHGGMLDRFDSLLMTGAFLFFIRLAAAALLYG